MSLLIKPEVSDLADPTSIADRDKAVEADSGRVQEESVEADSRQVEDESVEANPDQVEDESVEADSGQVEEESVDPVQILGYTDSGSESAPPLALGTSEPGASAHSRTQQEIIISLTQQKSNGNGNSQYPQLRTK